MTYEKEKNKYADPTKKQKIMKIITKFRLSVNEKWGGGIIIVTLTQNNKNLKIEFCILFAI